jgi:glycosyltransferase involved in cell wall biosynthesis
LKVSIITAVYNNREHIGDCIRSVLDQTYPEVEHIVVDGGSTDGTAEIIRENEKNIAIWVSEEDGGMYDALNKGIGMATGDIIGVLHSDDLFHSADTIAHIVGTFIKTNCDAVYGNLVYTQRNDPARVIRYWRSKPFKRGMLWKGWMPPHPTLFVRKKWYEKVGGFRSDFRIAADYDFMLRLFSCKYLVSSHLDEIVTRMRTGGASNRSLKNIYLKSKEDYIALKENHVGGFITLFLKNIQKVVQFVKKEKS